MAIENALALIASEGKTLEVYDGTNTTWLTLPGLMDWTMGDTSRDTRSVGTDSDRPTGTVSSLKAPVVTSTHKVVASPAWDLISTAFDGKDILNFRMTTHEDIVLPQTESGVTCAIAADGTCTFVGGTPSRDQTPIGSSIKIGNAQYVIASVTTSGVKVVAPSAAVAAAQYSVVTAAERIEYRGKIAKTPTREHGIAQQSEREGDLEVQCLYAPGDPVRLVS